MPLSHCVAQACHTAPAQYTAEVAETRRRAKCRVYDRVPGLRLRCESMKEVK